MQMCIFMEEHYTVCQHSMPCSEWPYAVFSVSQYTCNIIMIPYCMNSTISTPFLSQKTVAIIFLADSVCLNFFGLFGECVHPPLWLLFGFNIHKWNPGFIACYPYNVIEKFIAISVVSLKKKSKPKPFFVFCVHPWAFLEPTLCKTCDRLA
jgi:hypothetical protein